MARAPRSFRFLTEAGAVADGKALAETARRAEATGIDVLVLADHLINPYEAVATRVARLEEAVAVLKRSFGRSPFSFNGDHYTITELDARPKPIQRPHPPLFIGGGGRRLLSLAGREADIVGFAPRLLPGVRAIRGASRSPPPRRRSAGCARLRERASIGSSSISTRR